MLKGTCLSVLRANLITLSSMDPVHLWVMEVYHPPLIGKQSTS